LKRLDTEVGVKRIDFFRNQLILFKKDKSLNIVEGKFLSPKQYLDKYLVDYGLKIYDLITKEKIEESNQGFSSIFAINKNELLCKKVDYEKENVDYYIFSFIDKDYNKIKRSLEGAPAVFVDDEYLINRSQEFIYCYKNYNQIWQLDISDLCAYDVGNGLEKAELSNLYSDEEFVYLLAGLSILKVSIQSGEIIWHTKLNTAQSRGLIQDGYLYTTSNAYINKIDCQTGQILYQEGFDYITIDHEKTLGPIKELAWYGDSIWTIMDSNPSALIEINPTDGSYKSVVPLKVLGITKDCQMPRFHDDKMYLLDFDGTLHIFELS